MSSMDRPVLSGVKVPVVDDHRDSAQLLAAALEPYGVAEMTAGSAPEARVLLSATDIVHVVATLVNRRRPPGASSRV
jgi:CheY-like chemotaxis protein